MGLIFFLSKNDKRSHEREEFFFLNLPAFPIH